MNSYSDRYADNWLKETVPKAHRASRGVCCHCHQRASKNIHHVRYKTDDGKANAGKEIIGVDVFPLCEQCHDSVAHGAQYWRRVKHNPELNNHNVDEFVTRLKIGLELTRHIL